MHVPLCCFLYVSYGADKENFFQQSRGSLVVDTVVILYWSLYMMVLTRRIYFVQRSRASLAVDYFIYLFDLKV